MKFSRTTVAARRRYVLARVSLCREMLTARGRRERKTKGERGRECILAILRSRDIYLILVYRLREKYGRLSRCKNERDRIFHQRKAVSIHYFTK